MIVQSVVVIPPSIIPLFKFRPTWNGIFIQDVTRTVLFQERHLSRNQRVKSNRLYVMIRKYTGLESTRRCATVGTTVCSVPWPVASPSPLFTYSGVFRDHLQYSSIPERKFIWSRHLEFKLLAMEKPRNYLHASLDTSRYGDITRVEMFMAHRSNYCLSTCPKKIHPFPSDYTWRLLRGDWFRVYLHEWRLKKSELHAGF